LTQKKEKLRQEREIRDQEREREERERERERRGRQVEADRRKVEERQALQRRQWQFSQMFGEDGEEPLEDRREDQQDRLRGQGQQQQQKRQREVYDQVISVPSPSQQLRKNRSASSSPVLPRPVPEKASRVKASAMQPYTWGSPKMEAKEEASWKMDGRWPALEGEGEGREVSEELSGKAKESEAPARGKEGRKEESEEEEDDHSALFEWDLEEKEESRAISGKRMKKKPQKKMAASSSPSSRPTPTSAIPPPSTSSTSSTTTTTSWSRPTPTPPSIPSLSPSQPLMSKAAPSPSLIPTGTRRPADRVSGISQELEEVKDVMSKNLDSVLQRGESLEKLVERTADLDLRSQAFVRKSKKMVCF
jgi:hypothetical protein